MKGIIRVRIGRNHLSLIQISLGRNIFIEPMNGADSMTVHRSNPHVAIFAPFRSPGVPDDVIDLTLLGGAVANSVDYVVEGSDTAFGRVENAFLVSFENV